MSSCCYHSVRLVVLPGAAHAGLFLERLIALYCCCGGDRRIPLLEMSGDSCCRLISFESFIKMIQCQEQRNAIDALAGLDTSECLECVEVFVQFVVGKSVIRSGAVQFGVKRSGTAPLLSTGFVNISRTNCYLFKLMKN